MSEPHPHPRDRRPRDSLQVCGLPTGRRGALTLLALSFPGAATLLFVAWLERAAAAAWPPVQPKLLELLVTSWFLASLALGALVQRVGGRWLLARARARRASASGASSS